MMGKENVNISILSLTCIITVISLTLLGTGTADDSSGGPISGTINGTPVFIQNPNYADAFLTVPQLIRKYNYPIEVHYVTTPDGYILALHRIPYGVNSPPGNGTRPIVYIQHGLISSSSTWVINGAESSLAFMMADLGYDVWLGNFRGNSYSRNHTTFDPNQSPGPFWDFCFDENAKYDVPTSIQYMLNTTGLPNLIYIGHSMGTTSFFAAAASIPIINQQVKLFVALAPVVYMTHVTSPVHLLAPLVTTGVIQQALLSVGGEILANNTAVAAVELLVCATEPTADLVCDNSYFLVYGIDYPQFNNSQLPVYQSNYPQGGSLKQIAHYGQYMNKQKFCKFDYGVFNPLKYNGKLTPPCYDLRKVTVPTALYYGNNDLLADPTDVEILINSGILPNVVKTQKVPYPSFNHGDFNWAIDVKTLVYNDVAALMAKY